VIGLKVNDDKTKYMVMYRDQNVGRSHNIKKIVWNSFNNWEQPSRIKFYWERN